MKGAGGTSGGIGQFFMGLLMMCGGFYLLLNVIPNLPQDTVSELSQRFQYKAHG